MRLEKQGRTLVWAKKVRDGGLVEWLNEKDIQVDLPNLDGTVELAITGEVFNILKNSNNLDAIFPHIRVFARMNPPDKIAVVEEYITRGMVTLMCGDGANDCGALRAAHVGVALSDSEASVVSPFTGLNKSAMDVVEVLLEGRSGLASSFASYKYMIMYGQVETFNQIVNAYFAITFSEWCWVFMDVSSRVPLTVLYTRRLYNIFVWFIFV
jgi:magnesium-transporting ATPase (P-type)